MIAGVCYSDGKLTNMLSFSQEVNVVDNTHLSGSWKHDMKSGILRQQKHLMHNFIIYLFFPYVPSIYPTFLIYLDVIIKSDQKTDFILTLFQLNIQ
jgi:hypothetical protein